MTLRDTVGLAFQALRGNILRSVLTALGVIIGIAAVIVMVAIGQGTQARLDAVISSLGSNRLEVQSGAGRTGGARLGAGSKPTLTQGDADAIKRETGARGLASTLTRNLEDVAFGSFGIETKGAVQVVMRDDDIAVDIA